MRAYWLRALVLRMVRPLFVKDIDPNEDFACAECGKPVLRRQLYCSVICTDMFEDRARRQQYFH